MHLYKVAAYSASEIDSLPADLRKEYDGIKANSNNFNDALHEIFENNDKILDGYIAKALAAQKPAPAAPKKAAPGAAKKLAKKAKKVRSARKPKAAAKAAPKPASKEGKEAKEARAEKIEEVTKQASQRMSAEEVLAAARAINKLRSAGSQFIDNGSDNRLRLSPTPENLVRWAHNPGKFDLIGVDTASASTATSDLKISTDAFWKRLKLKK